jgi:hypothetical protein
MIMFADMPLNMQMQCYATVLYGQRMTDLEEEVSTAASGSFNVVPNYRDEIVTVSVGDVYEFVVPMSTRAGHVHMKGSTLTVLAKTPLIAWGERSASGFNWYCETTHGRSIWTSLEQCISRRTMAKIASNGQAH